MYHCDDCDVCIEEYDHHCPWTSKCIGRGNLIPFYVFVGSTLILFFYLIVMTMFLISQLEDIHRHERQAASHTVAQITQTQVLLNNTNTL